MANSSGPTLVYWDRKTGNPIVIHPEWAFDYIASLFEKYLFDENKGVWGFVETNPPDNQELRYIPQLRKGDTKRTWTVEAYNHPPEVKLLLLLAK